ncbi:MAG: 5-formyltetrahydrofolate cyclo-ligase [Thermoproteota archaeon]|nr:5-formyltetrahydrofolate cyclo-ligase [Thermoproteota archaeon]
MSSLSIEKERIRRSMLKMRNSVSQSEVFEKSNLIQLNVLRSNHFAISESLGVYLPIDNEVRTQEIIQRGLDSAKKVALPSIESNRMRFYQLDDRLLRESSLVIGKFGIWEPHKRGAEITKLDLLIVPGIAFDYGGARIGYGRGYFDRYITNAKVSFSLGLGYQFQLVSRPLPQSNFDQRINGLSTENGILYF